ncbi:MAG: TIGR00730 family Rossman fold protein [Acidobacteriota bacterium]
MTDSPTLRTLAVFCGSNSGASPAYGDAARTLGREMTSRGTTLVYGGGDVGLMGIVADTVMAGQGKVIGVLPEVLVKREVAHHGITDLILVDTMHERKQRMYEMADAIVALPGGIGTLDELFETFTWNQLGVHFKPLGLLDVDGYWDPLVDMLDRMVDRGFLHAETRAMLAVDADPVRLLDRLASARPVSVEKWLDRAHLA